MHIGILGTGGVARTLAAALAGLHHGVELGTREVSVTLARRDPDAMGRPPVAEWLAEHPGVGLVGLQEAAAGAEVVVNATSGTGSVAAVRAAAEDGRLAGKVLLDVANPLDFSAGFPPTLFLSGSDSLGEQVQRAAPEARVVKSLNMVTASVMVAPGSAGPEAAVVPTMLVAGDDPGAKTIVAALLTELGWTDVLDIGDLAGARAMEQMLPVWLRVLDAVGTAEFAFAVVR